MPRPRTITPIRAAFAALLAAVTAIALIATTRPATAADTAPAPPAYLTDQLAACQADVAVAVGLDEQAWAAHCVALAQRAVDAWVAAHPAPSPSPTVSASPTVSPTVPPTTPPATTPPATTPPVTTPPATTPPPTSSPAGCPVAGRNVPGAADPWGGCWPGPGNTGVPAGTVLTAYTGACTIIQPGLVLDSKTITCATLDIRAPGVMIVRSMLQGTDVTDDATSSASFSIIDSTVVNGAREQCLCIGDHNFSAVRVEVRGGNRSMYCASTCTVTDSWLHGQQLQGAQHGSGLREEQGTTARHNVLVCDFPITNDATSLGCSADLTGYPDFAPIKNNTITRNLMLASPTDSFCAYGGATGGKPFSSDPTNATNQVFTENVFQRGANRLCGFYGPVTNFDPSRAGNVWSGNVWDDGATVPPG